MFKRLALLLSFLLLSGALFAAPADYGAWIKDIEGRLDRTVELYQQKQVEEAKAAVQMAYFEVFENLEGPIRINFSAQKSYEMEAAFGEIRRMIMDGKPLAEVQKRAAWLKEQLRAVQPSLESGHTLNAQGAHGAYDNPDIAPFWQDRFRQIDDLLAEGISLYQEGKAIQAREKIQQAQYDGFKNSEMEIAIRQGRSSKQTQAINQQFSQLLALAEQPDQLTELGYQITTLLQDIEEQLPGLPAPVQAGAADVAVAEGANSNWSEVSATIDGALRAALASYESGKVPEAIMAVQNAYFDHFEASSMENRIGARDAAFKTTLEAYFTRMAGLMKAGKPVAELHAQADALKQDLDKAATMLGGGQQSFWSLAVMSLVIILREGLEALLIVAAIVAYLVKSGHRDKLPLIRQSVIAALVASVATAGAFYLLFTNAGAQRELLEGFTMIIAVFVLFGMSYWLLSKAEARHWKAYLEGKLSASISKGSLFGLWFASFLAVYREGAETVLFYQALIADAQGAAGNMALLGGFLLGCVILLIVYFIMRFSVVRLPLKPFFIFTGSFMYLMAFVFAGKSMLELIEGKLFEPMLWSWAPEIGVLGIYPYRETLIPQIILLIAALLALWVMKRNPAGEGQASSPASA